MPVNGHIPVVNKIVNAYRRASIDPYVSEVTKRDIPNWFVFLPPSEDGEAAQRRVVCLYSGIVRDSYPTIPDGLNEESRLLYAASEADVLNQIKTEALPGELDLLDGWSRFYSGRFQDSIRLFGTAIEVLIESEVRKLLTKSEYDEHVIQTKLEKTRNNFDSRITQLAAKENQREPSITQPEHRTQDLTPAPPSPAPLLLESRSATSAYQLEQFSKKSNKGKQCSLSAGFELAR